MKTAAAVLAALIAFTLGLLSCTPPANSAESTPGVTYSAHVQRIGWQAPVDDGATAGTTGRALRVEALRLSPSGGATLSWRGHVQKVGWQSWRDTPNMIGTTGKGLRLEALQITVKDKGALYGAVSVEYRAHVQGIGWQPWRRDGQTAGTTGKGLRVEAVQIRIVQGPEPEPTPTPSSTATPAPSPTVTPSTPAPTLTPGCVRSGGGWLCYGTTPPASGVSLAFTADVGLGTAGKATLSKIGNSTYNGVFMLGDLAYKPNAGLEFGEVVKSRISDPTFVVAGNHEEQGSADGPWAPFVQALPDPGSSKVYTEYGRDYYVDRGNVRVFMIAPDVVFPGMTTYASGTPEREWLKDKVREAKAAGMWTIIAKHHPCFSPGANAGGHGCESTTPAVDELAMNLGVSAVFSGHDHNLGISKQIRGTAGSPVVIDGDRNYQEQTEAGPGGTVFIVTGHAGHNPRKVAAPGGIWDVTSGSNSPGGISFGYTQVDTYTSGVNAGKMRIVPRLASGPNLGNPVLWVSR
jgi:hypothetical protein